MLIKNGHIISLIYSREGDLNFFQPIAQKRAHTLQPLREEALALTLNAL
jgi:hypothetical protein